MKENWTYLKLGDISQIKSGYTPTSEELHEVGDIPYFKVGDMNIEGNEMFLKKSSSFLLYPCKTFPQNSIVFPKNGAAIATNKKRILKQPSVVDLNTAILIPSSNYNTKFLYYWINNLDFRTITRRGAVPTLDIQALKSFKVPCISLAEQERIVSELDLLSGIIDKQKAQLKELDNLAQSIFYDMFGDPVENEKGWEIVLFKDIATFKNGLNYHPIKDGNAIKCIGVGDFQDRKELRCFDQIKEFTISETVEDSYYLQDGDIIIVRSNGSKELVGRNMVIYPGCQKITYSGFCIRCRISAPTIMPIVLNRILSNKSTMMVLRQEGRGCNISNINQRILSSLPIIMPPIELQKEYANKVEMIEKQKELINLSIKETETLFNSRMHYYFN